MEREAAADVGLAVFVPDAIQPQGECTREPVAAESILGGRVVEVQWCGIGLAPRRRRGEEDTVERLSDLLLERREEPVCREILSQFGIEIAQADDEQPPMKLGDGLLLEESRDLRQPLLDLPRLSPRGTGPVEKNSPSTLSI